MSEYRAEHYWYEIEIFTPCEGDENYTVTAARHDLIWHQVEYFGLEWDTTPVGGWQILAEGFTDSNIVKGLNFRQELLRLNPNIILLANLNYRDEEAHWLPDDHEWWKRYKNGNKRVIFYLFQPPKLPSSRFASNEDFVPCRGRSLCKIENYNHFSF